jgi:hypothetical protein
MSEKSQSTDSELLVLLKNVAKSIGSYVLVATYSETQRILSNMQQPAQPVKPEKEKPTQYIG